LLKTPDKIRDIYRRLAANWARLFAAGIVASALGLVTLSITARELGAGAFGILILIMTFARLVDGIFNFQTAQALVKFGMDAQVDGHKAMLAGLLRFSVWIDCLTALLSFAIANLAIALLSEPFGLSPAHVGLAHVATLIIPFNIVGAATGILRLVGRISWVAAKDLTIAVTRLAGAAALVFLASDLQAFVMLWVATELAGSLVLIGLAIRTVPVLGLAGITPAPARVILKSRPGFMSALWATNLTSGIRHLSDEGDVLLVGALLGSPAAGLFRIAKQFAGILQRLARPLQDAAYPEISRLWAEGDRSGMLRTAATSSLVGGGAGCCFMIVLGISPETVISLTVGGDYLDAARVMMIMAAAYTLYLFGITILPLILTLERSRDWLLVTIVCTLIFFAVFPVLVHFFGLEGAAMAHGVYIGCWFALSALSIARALKMTEAKRPVLDSPVRAP